ncbi:MAG: hypothetical protein H7326_08930 [Bdellovibrionaceae bacterium]|nr:hypothetical protein [Pseudobdellovibrionaceae bacterium]
MLKIKFLENQVRNWNTEGSAFPVIIAIVAFVGLFSSYLASSMLVKAPSANAGIVFERQAITTYMNQIVSIVENDNSWLASIAANPSLSCLAASGLTCPTGPQPINLLLGPGSVYDSYSGAEGFDKFGIPCNLYSATDGDPTCIYKVRLTWEAVCAAPPCVSARAVGDLYAKTPEQQLSLQVFFSSRRSQRTDELKVSAGDMVFTRKSVFNSVGAFCEALSGELVAGGLHCRIKLQPHNCRTAESKNMVDRIRPDGKVICKNPTLFGAGTDLERRCGHGVGFTGLTGDDLTCTMF